MEVRTRSTGVAALAALVVAAGLGTGTAATAVPPSGNTVAQWNAVAEDAVLRSGSSQPEGFVYMAYTAAAVYDAVVAIEGGFEPYGPGIEAPVGASTDAAVVEAAYRSLVHSFPSQSGRLAGLHAEALEQVSDGAAKRDGRAVGLAAAQSVRELRDGDGRLLPVGTSSSFPGRQPAAGVWRLTPPFAPPQTPWVGGVRPFVLTSPAQFLPEAPPSPDSAEWVAGFEQIKAQGAATGAVRTDEQTRVARFYTANVVRQYNRAGRDLAGSSDLLETARLVAAINLVGADALISTMHAKYHYLYWRPVTAIDPSAVVADGFGPVPGHDDGNPETAEQAGWRPLLTTPNHPEYPAAHGALTSAMAEVLSAFRGSNDLDLDLHGFDPAGPAGNLDAVRHFASPADLRREIVDARLWAGLHYRSSSVAGVVLGRNVAKHDLRNAFQPTG